MVGRGRVREHGRIQIVFVRVLPYLLRCIEGPMLKLWLNTLRFVGRGQGVTEASGLVTREPRMSQSQGNTENARIEKV
jgi:hypothetical protein